MIKEFYFWAYTQKNWKQFLNKYIFFNKYNLSKLHLLKSIFIEDLLSGSSAKKGIGNWN